MFQYIKRNNLKRGDSPNNDFGFLADQLMGHLRLTMGHLKLTMGHLRLTIGYLKATLG